MQKLRRGPRWVALVTGLALAGVCGCQTWVPSVGMTLPSPRYLKHNPQYIPETPAFPLSKELARMEEQEAVTSGPPLPNVVPAAAPVVPGPVGP